MASNTLEFTPVREALGELLGSLLDDADVGLIDLGSDPVVGKPVLRVHLRNFTALQRLSFPGEVDGVAIHLIVQNYPLRG